MSVIAVYIGFVVGLLIGFSIGWVARMRPTQYAIINPDNTLKREADTHRERAESRHQKLQAIRAVLEEPE